MSFAILTLPKPPTENTYRRVFRGRPVISEEGREFRRAVQRHVDIMEIEKLSGRLAVRIEYYVPDKRKRDLDNILKALFDAMCLAGVYEDDEQIDILFVERRTEIIKGGFVVVTIEELQRGRKA